MAMDPAKRRTFVNSVVPFLQKEGFDGIGIQMQQINLCQMYAPKMSNDNIYFPNSRHWLGISSVSNDDFEF